MNSQYNFNVHINDEIKLFTEIELGQYAESLGLKGSILGRCSWLFIMQLYLLSTLDGVDPSMIVSEIESIECNLSTVGTKPATEFKKLPLKGLWHKHYFSAKFIPQNLVNHHSRGRLQSLINEIMDPVEYPIVTRELINKVAYEVVTGAMESREADGKLTGEWIVFAKHSNQNYYLCLATHESGDDIIYNQIKSACFHQYPFLKPD
jgi:hypothetical protein